MSIVYQCPDCRQQLKAPANHVGKRTTCPECGTSFQIPESDDLGSVGVTERRPNVFATQPTVRRDDGGADYYSERDRRLKKAQSQSNALKLMLAVGIPILLILLAVSIWLIARSRLESLPTGLDLVPQDAAVFVSVDFDKIRDGPTMKKLRKQFPQIMTELEATTRRKLGLEPDNVSRVIVVVRKWPENLGWAGEAQPAGWIIASTKEPFDRNRVRGKLGARVRTTTIAGKTCFLPHRNGKKSACVHFYDDQTIVVASNESEMRDCLRHAANVRRDGPLSRPLQVASYKAVVVGFQPAKTGLQGLAKKAQGMPVDAQGDLKAGTLALHEIGREIEISLELLHGSENEAIKSAKNVDQLIAMGKATLAFKKVMAGDDKQRALFGLAEQFLESAKVESDGSTTLVRGKINLSDKLGVVAEALQAMQKKGDFVDIPRER